MKKLALVLFLVIAAVGLWWWESPHLATENLLDAARDGDTAELEELVDAERFQASLRAELAVPEPVPAETSIPDRAPPAFVPPVTRPTETAPAMDPLLAGLAGDAALIRLREAARTDWEIDRRGFSAFHVVRRSGDGKPLPTLVFARDGVHWKLVGVAAVS